MIHHIIKLIWNRRRSLAWIFIEQMLVFGVMLFIITQMISNITRQYAKGTIRVDNVAIINFEKIDKSEHDEDEHDDSKTQFRNMVERMKQWQSVDLITIGSNGAIPYMSGVKFDSISFRERRFNAAINYCDEVYYRMFSPKLTEGQWFRDTDVSEIPPALITQLLAERLELTGSAIGQNIYYNGRTFRITGVIEAFKHRASENDQLAALFIPVSTLSEENKDWTYAIQYKKGQFDEFSRAFLAEFYRSFSREQLQPGILDLKEAMTQIDFLGFSLFAYLLGVPTVFLLIFAFLGTFGLVWMQSKKRISEFGLRMAMGCTSARLQRTIILENLILTTFAMLPGLIVMANLYAFAPKGWGWIAAVGAAIVLMWLFAAFSAWYPAWKASRVQPVEALRANQ